MNQQDFTTVISMTAQAVFRQPAIPFSPDPLFRDIPGFDSVLAIQFILAIESALDVTLNEDEVDTMHTMGDLLDAAAGEEAIKPPRRPLGARPNILIFNAQPLRQPDALQLAGGAFGNFLEEDDRPGHLEWRQPPGHEPPQCFGIGGGAVRQHHGRGHILTEGAAGHREGYHLLDRIRAPSGCCPPLSARSFRRRD